MSKKTIYYNPGPAAAYSPESKAKGTGLAMLSPGERVPPDRVKYARNRAGLTQVQAERYIRLKPQMGKTWAHYEKRGLHPGLFELFLLRTGQTIPEWLKTA